MVIHYEKPCRKVLAINDDISDKITAIDVIRKENAVDTAKISVADFDGAAWMGQIDTGYRLRIYLNYKDVEDPPTLIVFDGFVDEVRPHLSDSGKRLVCNARQIGRSILNMVCGDEYGSQSVNPSLDTMKEILVDNTNGLIDNWTNKVLGGSSSGYNLDTTYIADIKDASNPIKYLYFPYKPVFNCLNDLTDLTTAIMQGASTPTAGPHWIITPDNYLCIGTVGAHETAVETQWPTWWNTNRDESTLTVTQDMILAPFHKLEQEANYILYSGILKKPGDGDRWTENNSSDWSVTGNDVGTPATISDEASIVVMNDYSIKVTTGDGAAGSAIAKYPDAGGQDWDITKWGGKYNIPSLNFYVKVSSNLGRVAASSPIAYFHTTNDANYFECTIGSFIPASTSTPWALVKIPLGPYAAPFWRADDRWIEETGSPDWGNIDYIKLEFGTNDSAVATVYIDGLHFSGHVIRGANVGAAYTKFKVITDNIGKDDSGVASDDTYPMARLAYAELLRASTTPLIGQIAIPAKPSIMAGQLCHIHAYRFGTNYRVDTDMRILEHWLSLAESGYYSYLTLTDDVTNGRPRPPMNAYNLIQKATHPEAQTRQISSIKTRDIDITQPILLKTY